MTGFASHSDYGTPWLDAGGAHGDLVLSTRVRLARNLAGIPFWGRNSPSDRAKVVDRIRAAAAHVPTFVDATLYQLDEASAVTRQWLNERQLVSRDLAGLGAAGHARRGGALLLGHSASAMINEEDHLRLQSLRAGFALEAAYAETAGAERELGVRVSFAFHSEFGYLTACPTNVGTGMRASVLVHLPALTLTREITKVLHGLTQVGLTSRGLFGEGSEALGHWYQLSNQTTLGKTEGELLDHLATMVRRVMDYEERARDALIRESRSRVEDSMWRAWAILHHARTLSFEEMVNLLSSVRMGTTMRTLPGAPLHVLNHLLVYAQTAHLAQRVGANLEDEAMPEHRATLVRQVLGETETE